MVDKPAGLPVHGGAGVRQNLLAEMRRQSPNLDLTLIHRLDRETSGLMVMVKGKGKAQKYHQYLRESAKIYLALCKGRFRRRPFICDQRIEERGKWKGALTQLEGLHVLGPYSLIRAHPLTGRTHQIRYHLSQLGYPVLGDDKYGDFSLNRLAARQMGLSHLYLHAWELIFPMEGVTRSFRADLPPSFQALLKRYNVPFKKISSLKKSTLNPGSPKRLFPYKAPWRR